MDKSYYAIFALVSLFHCLELPAQTADDLEYKLLVQTAGEAVNEDSIAYALLEMAPFSQTAIHTPLGE